jgi:hypothetical protein
LARAIARRQQQVKRNAANMETCLPMVTSSQTGVSPVEENANIEETRVDAGEIT